MKKKTHVGSSLESFLEEDGLREEVYAEAAKRVVALQLRKAMKATGTTVSEMARRMATSRSQVERVIGPESESVTLVSLAKAAHAMGYRLNMNLVKVSAAARSSRALGRNSRAKGHRAQRTV
jgi:antitoxin HicB